MKNPAQIIILIILLAGGFWIGIKWGENAREKKVQEQLDAIIDERNNRPTTPIVLKPVGSTDPTVPVTTDTTTPTPTPTEVMPTTTTEPVIDSSTTTNSTVTVDLTKPLNPDEKVTTYENASFGYKFDLPMSVYYAAFGAQGGATHTVAIKKEASPETLADSTVRVYYYGKKVLPELQNATVYQDPNGKFLEILVDGTHSVKIEADDLNSSIVLRIVQTFTVKK